MTEPVNPRNLADVVKYLARKEAEKVVRPLEAHMAKLETTVAQLEKKAHSH